MGSKFSTCFAFILFALMLFKVSSFHVYTHQDESLDDIENCKTCELAVENENSDYVSTVSQTVKTPNTIDNTNNQSVAYELVILSSSVHYNFFGRPPPKMG